MIGCIGNGKSSLLNKLQFIIDKDQPKLQKYFVSTNSTETVTTEIKSLDLQGKSSKIRLLDTQGFECLNFPKFGEVWERMILQLAQQEDKLSLKKHGLSLILFPIMIESGIVENK